MNIEKALRHRKSEFWLEIKSQIEDFQSVFEINDSWSKCADSILIDLFDFVFKDDDIALFALGKLGSSELNLSSDVDLTFVAKERTAELIKKIRLFSKLLQEVTESGFVFRVDYNLRPGGVSSPLLPSVDEYCDYYTRLGETWERIAMYRMRPLAGSTQIIKEIKNFNERFIFRKHLDYKVFSDVTLLRSRILSEKNNSNSKHILDLKFAPGGIRDIELFLHSLVVIHGGRNSKIRKGKIPDLITALAAANILSSEEGKTLNETYQHLRFLENYIQYQDDQQTYIIFLNHTYPASIQSSLQSVQALLQVSKQIVRSLLGDELLGGTLEQLTAQFQSYLPSDPETQKLGLSLFHDFLKAIEAKPSFFSLLEKEVQIMKDLASLFSRSPYLSQILISRPELLDSFLFRRTEVRTEEWDVFLDDLIEKRLLSEIVIGNQFLESRQLESLIEAQTSVAEEVCQLLLKKLINEFSAQIDIICLGKWGSRELGLASDLDFIFVTREELSPLHHKIAQRFISRITERHRGGSLYSIDMRLKPQFGSGALVITENALDEFLNQQPPVWIRQAYLRSRRLGSLECFQGIQNFISRGLTDSDLVELSQIQRDLYNKSTHPDDIKFSPGGILDIELAFQAYLLNEKRSIGGLQKPIFHALHEFGFSELSQILKALRVAEQLKTLGRPQSEDKRDEVQNLLSASRKELKNLDPRPRSS